MSAILLTTGKKKKQKPYKWFSHVPMAILGKSTLVFSRTLGMLALSHFNIISLQLNIYLDAIATTETHLWQHREC